MPDAKLYMTIQTKNRFPVFYEGRFFKAVFRQASLHEIGPESLAQTRDCRRCG